MYHLPGLAGLAETSSGGGVGGVCVCAGVRKVGTQNPIQHNDLFHLGIVCCCLFFVVNLFVLCG